MIKKSLLNLNDTESEEISLPKDKFSIFIHDYVSDDLKYPSEEEAKACYKAVLGDNEEYTFNMMRKACRSVTGLSFKLSDSYTLKNNEFDYECDCPKKEGFLESEDLGYKEMAALYYFTNYLKKNIELTSDVTARRDNPTAKEMREGVVEAKQFIARCMLYSEAFERLGEKEALELVLRNMNRVKDVLPLSIYVTKVWKIMEENIDFYNAYY